MVRVKNLKRIATWTGFVFCIVLVVSALMLSAFTEIPHSGAIGLASFGLIVIAIFIWIAGDLP
jgi:hypothetical protein